MKTLCKNLVTATALLLALVGLTAVASPAHAAGAPVRSLAMTSQADHAATVTWSAPKSAKVVQRYRIRWGTDVARTRASVRSFTVTGIPNDAATRVYVRPVFRDGSWGRRASVAVQGAAPVTPPPAPAQPTISVAKGAQCNTSSTGCPGAVIACTSTCWYVVANASNFAGTATCQAYDAASRSPFGGSWSQANGAKQTSTWVGPGVSFYLACSNDARSATTTW